MDNDQGNQDLKGAPKTTEPQTKAERDAARERETARLLEMGKTEVGRKAVFELFGVRDEPRILDAWGEQGHPDYDAERKAAEDGLRADFGGEEGFAKAMHDLREFAGVIDPTGELAEEIDAAPLAEQVAAIKSQVAEARELLSNPEKAREALALLYGEAERGNLHPYFLGKASPEATDFITKLWQAAHGEKVVGRPRPKGDGHVY